MSRLVSKSDFASLCSVTKAAITKACRSQFPAGMVGGRIDLDHPDVQSYLATKRSGPTARAERAEPEPDGPTQRRHRVMLPEPPEDDAGEAEEERPRREPTRRQRPRREPARRPAVNAELQGRAGDDVSWDDIEQYADQSLRWLTERFGTATAFVDWLDARKTISDIRAKDLKNDELAGRLISRDLVKAHVFGAIENANRRILGDASTTITRRLYSAARSGATVEEADAIVREILSQTLHPVKATASRVLREG
jgi:hypothetical protein